MLHFYDNKLSVQLRANSREPFIMPRQPRKTTPVLDEGVSSSSREELSKKLRTNISSAHPLPVNIDLSKLREKQTDIILKLHESGLSYQQIADLFNVDRGVNLSNYVARKPKRINQAKSEYIKLIHAKLLESDNEIKRLLPTHILADYKSFSNPNGSEYILFKKKTDSNLSPESMGAWSAIFNDIFDGGSRPAIESLRRVCGKYYAYRNSSESGKIVKSFLEIREHSRQGAYFDFEHFHPDRIYDKDLGDTPRRTHGLVFYLNNNIFMIGNTESGQTMNIFGIREPFGQHFHVLFGFNLTTNMDHILFSTLMIFEKDESASMGHIERFPVEKFPKMNTKFKKELLENQIDKGAHICTLLSMVRL
jgi:hypothetical protein